jgi:hypothetical protein
MSFSGSSRLAAPCVALLVLLADVGAAPAEIGDLEGRWSSNPPRCEQANGEVDVLTITSSELTFYEIGCKLSRPRRGHDEFRFAARCYKGGSPETAGAVVIRRLSRDKIDLALLGFFWTTAKPEAFHRCSMR